MITQDTNSNNVKAVLFDLDGTLANTLEDLYLATNYSLNKYHYKEIKKEDFRHIIGNGVVNQITKACPKDVSNINLVLETYKDYYIKHSTDHIYIYDGIYDVLKKLKEKNIKLGIVTNKFNEAVIKIYEEYFKDYMDFYLGESPNMNKKPAPDMLLYACKKLNVEKDEIIYVGDSEVDIKTCENLSVKILSALWGYRTKEELIKNNAKILLEKPIDILNYI